MWLEWLDGDVGSSKTETLEVTFSYSLNNCVIFAHCRIDVHRIEKKQKEFACCAIDYHSRDHLSLFSTGEDNSYGLRACVCVCVFV